MLRGEQTWLQSRLDLVTSAMNDVANIYILFRLSSNVKTMCPPSVTRVMSSSSE